MPGCVDTRVHPVLAMAVRTSEAPCAHACQPEGDFMRAIGERDLAVLIPLLASRIRDLTVQLRAS